MQQQKERCNRTRDVNEKLQHIRPNYGLQTSFESIEKRENGDDRDGRAVACAKRDAHHLAHSRYSHTFGQGPSDQKNHRSRGLDPRPKPLLQ